MSEQERNIPLADQMGFAYATFEQIKITRAQLGQKMHMEARTPEGVDYGDQYFHQGLGMMEQTQQQLMHLQCWIKDNVQPIISAHPMKDIASAQQPNATNNNSNNNLGKIIDFIVKHPVVSVTIFFILCAGAGETVYIANHGIDLAIVQGLFKK
ncbi:MAG: hypothetical protein K0Q50_193 [Vampirovibrio sp.]|jgi:hypothetical protein|nr:hypothetical protein [Vampirovibrio sp.]